MKQKWMNILMEVVIFMSLIGTIAYLTLNPDGNVTGTTKLIVGFASLFLGIGFIMYIAKEVGMGGR